MAYEEESDDRIADLEKKVRLLEDKNEQLFEELREAQSEINKLRYDLGAMGPIK